MNLPILCFLKACPKLKWHLWHSISHVFQDYENIDLFYSVKSDDGTEPEKLVHPKVFRQLKRNWMIYRLYFFVFFLIFNGKQQLGKKKKNPNAVSITWSMFICRYLHRRPNGNHQEYISVFVGGRLLTTACRLKWFIGNVLPTRVSSSSFENQQQKRKNRLLHSLGQRLTHTHTHIRSH